MRECGYPRELGSREAGSQDVEYRHIERAAPYYKQFLHTQGKSADSIWTRSLLSLATKERDESKKAYLSFVAPTTEHENYLVGLDESKEPGILSVETTSSKRVGKQFVYRALLRTARVPRPRFDSPCVCVSCVY